MSLPHPPKPDLFLLPPNARLSWAERAGGGGPDPDLQAGAG